MTRKRPPICPSHGLPLDQLIWYGGDRYAWICAGCTRWRPIDIKLHRRLKRVFDETLDEIFGPDPPGQKSVPMSARDLDALLDRIAANGYAPPG